MFSGKYFLGTHQVEHLLIDNATSKIVLEFKLYERTYTNSDLFFKNLEVYLINELPGLLLYDAHYYSQL